MTWSVAIGFRSLVKGFAKIHSGSGEITAEFSKKRLVCHWTYSRVIGNLGSTWTITAFIVVTFRAIQSWNMQTVYEAAGGRDGLLRLASAWHTRVLEDEVVSHAFSHGYHPQHTERLAAYWAEALGGPTTYSDQYGDETSVVRTHSGNGLHEEMDQRAIACFDQALEDVGLARDERLRRVLHDYFAWATTTTMSRYHRSAEDVPDGLHIPKWSWDGRTG